MSVCPSVRLSVRMEKLGLYWTDFNEICYLSIFQESVQKFQTSLKSDKDNGYFIWKPIHSFDHILFISS